MQDVRTFKGEDVSSDHNLVVARLKIKLKRQGHPGGRRKIALSKLKSLEVINEFTLEINNRFFHDFVWYTIAQW